MHQQSPLDTQERLVLLLPRPGQINLAEAKLQFDLIGYGHVTVPHVPAVSPCSSQSNTGINAARAGRHWDRRKRRWYLLLEGGEQIGQQSMSPQPDPPIRQGFGGGEFDVKADLQQVTQFLLGLLLADFLIALAAMEKCQGDFLRVGRSEDQLQYAGRNIALFGQRVQIGQRQFASFHLPFDFGNLTLTENGFEGIASHNRQPGIAGRWLLPGLHDDPGAIEFDQGTIGFGALHRHVHDQARCLPFVEQMIHLFSQPKETAVVPGHGRVWDGKLHSRLSVGLLRVVPDNEAFLIYLLGDELNQRFSNDSHHFTSPFWRSCLPIEDHSYFPSRRSDWQSTRLNSSHLGISYALFCL